MDREELNQWIRLGPIRITMNSGDTTVRLGANPRAQFG